MSNDVKNPLSIDFTHGQLAYRLKRLHGTNELLAKAVGIKNDYKPYVIDATAGLGRDGFLLATLGCQVTLLERSPVVTQLLDEALKRAKAHSNFAGRLQINLIQTDSLVYLTKLTRDERPDVIYLDPMYPHRSKSALVKKEMRILRDIVGDDNDAGELLNVALQHALKRIVVKRPCSAPPLNNRKANFAIKGKTQRFDIYLPIR
jgi:16S rRNA (guanine1516-N2)-methyltransferase